MESLGGLAPIGSNVTRHVRDWMVQTGAPVESIRALNARIEDDGRTSTLKARERIGSLLRKYREPVMDEAAFILYLNSLHQELMMAEADKKYYREIFIFNTGNKNSYPKALMKIDWPAPHAKTYINFKGLKKMGTNPYSKKQKLLTYSKTDKWEHFKPLAWESVLNGTTEVEIPSLTVEKMIMVCEENGVSLESLGRIAVDYVKKHMPGVASKVNNMASEEVSLVFSTIANNLNVEQEIKLVEESISGVTREITGNGLSEAVNLYFGKQKLLARLRSGYHLREREADIEALATTHTMNAISAMVSEQTAARLMGPIQQQYRDAGLTFNIEKAVLEATKIEEEHPEWKPTSPRKATSIRAMTATFYPTTASINKLDGEEGQDENNEELVLEEDDFEDMILEDEMGELHYISKVKRVNLKPSSRQKQASPYQERGRGPKKRAFSKAKVRTKVNYVRAVSRSSKSPQRRLPQRRQILNRARSQSRGPRRFSTSRRPSQGRSKSPLRKPKSCLRCGSEGHLGDKCTRYRTFASVRCFKCSKSGRTLFHPPSLCLHDPESGWVEPGNRTPNTKKKFGFRSRERRGSGRSPSPRRQKSPQAASRKN